MLLLFRITKVTFTNMFEFSPRVVCVFLLKVERLVEEKECSLPAADALQMSYSRSCIWPPAVTTEEIARRDISISRE